MKTRIKLAMAAGLFTMALSSACKKDDNNPSTGNDGNQTAIVTFTIDGDDYLNKAVTIQGAKDVPDNEGLFFTTSGFAGIRIGDKPTLQDDNLNSFFLYFDPKVSGKEKCGDPFANQDALQTIVNFGFTLTGSNGSNDYGFNYSTVVGPTTPGNITITKYGAVDDTIEGDFEGDLINENTEVKVKISNGHFKVTRHKDNPL